MRRRAGAAAGQAVAIGAQNYERARCLPGLLPIAPEGWRAGPQEAMDEPAATRAIVARLADALRRERRLGRAGHWTYDLNRHIALAQAWRAETQRLHDRDERGARK